MRSLLHSLAGPILFPRPVVDHGMAPVLHSPERVQTEEESPRRRILQITHNPPMSNDYSFLPTYPDSREILRGSDMQSFLNVMACLHSLPNVVPDDQYMHGFSPDSGNVYVHTMDGVTICSAFGQPAFFVVHVQQDTDGHAEGEEVEFDGYPEAFAFAELLRKSY